MAYYIAKVQVQFADEKSGKIKNVTEQYLVEAVSVTDAEAIVTKAFQSDPRGFEVKSVNESKISEVLKA